MPLQTPFQELAGSGTHRFGDDGGSAVRLLLCDHAQADQLCAELLGFSRAVGLAHQRRQPPHRHPTRPHLYCQSARYEGWGAIGGVGEAISYPKARVTATYRPLESPNDGRTVTHITERRDFGAETLPLDPSRLRWEDGEPAKDNARLALLAPVMTITITVHHWFAAPVSAGVFEEMMGTVNAAPFRALWTSWPMESLLFEGASAERDFTSDGVSAWRVGLRFRFRRPGWNHAFRAETGRWERLLAGGAGIHETSNFERLLP